METPLSIQLHPLLDGANTEIAVLLDLSTHTFIPPVNLSLESVSEGPLKLDELHHPATQPGLRMMTIICDMIPQWPIHLRLSAHHARNDQPISIEDVLTAIHRHFQEQVSRNEWIDFLNNRKTRAPQAFLREYSGYRGDEQFEAEKGVRRVVYLRENHMFKGMVQLEGHRTNEDGYATFKLLVGSRS